MRPASAGLPRSTASRRKQARCSSRPPLPPRSSISAMPGSTISTAATSGASLPPTWTASAARSRAPTSNNYRAWVDAPLSVGIQAGTLYNAPPPTQGLASLIILGVVRPAARATGRNVRARARHRRGDQARLPGARQSRHRSRPHAPAISRAILSPAFLDEQVAKIDMRKAAQWPAPDGEGDTIWMGAADASGLVVSYIQSLYWEFGSGCVLPATGVLMQNRGASFSLRSGRAQRAGARPPPVPHAQPGARRAEGRPRHGLRHHGRRRPAAKPGRRVHPPRHFPPAARCRRSTRRAGCSAAPGARPTPICVWSRASTRI